MTRYVLIFGKISTLLIPFGTLNWFNLCRHCIIVKCHQLLRHIPLAPLDGTIYSERYSITIRFTRKHAFAVRMIVISSSKVYKHATWEETLSHSSRSTKRYINEHGAELYEWPGHFQDLEQSYRWKREYNDKTIWKPSNNQIQRWDSVCQLWYAKKVPKVSKMYDEMPARVEAVHITKVGSAVYGCCRKPIQNVSIKCVLYFNKFSKMKN